ncbi:winged helix DNA-binding domain-containing protein [Saccharothrix sp. S26]|uniref:winged helix DNA-binding domain-containing protein n=1 Tax=Saccharothrix sp. S26 TaxID=2907215 RepID=UPI001F247B2A|nr:winged helix DNA-binding domain-containing protein [Saccharothrix sp. S26]MCE6993631.1 winged helix DNA-binding domain-containing protein [Saccharothrix sp. S26]
MTPVLSRRALGRATLARQFLLARADAPVTEVVTHLVGLQAQTPHTWYTGLWSRIAGFTPDQAADALVNRQLVRIAVMRSTIHLVTAEDALALRPAVQPALDRDLFRNYTHGRDMRGLDVDAVVAAGRALLAEKPRTNKELGALLHERWPDRAPASLAYAIRCLVPLVQVPPRGVWGRSGSIAHTSAETWLGAPVADKPSVHDLVSRYLAAFGPATVKDVQTWSGLTRLREVVEELPLLRLRDEDGQELFDLPDAPRPDEDVPAPPRFLYDFDNVLLSHADRRRVVTDDVRAQGYEPHGPVPQFFLVDGVTAGDWTLHRTKEAATLELRPFRRLSTMDDVVREGRRLLAFLAPDAPNHEVRTTSPSVPRP